MINIIGEEKWSELRTRNEKEVMDKIQSRLTKFCDAVQTELPTLSVYDRLLMMSELLRNNQMGFKKANCCIPGVQMRFLVILVSGPDKGVI